MRATGCQWRAIPRCFVPLTTVRSDVDAWRDAGTLERLLVVLRDQAQVGRSEEPTAAAMMSQSVKTTESAGPSGDDAGKKIKGRKRPMAVDVEGFPIAMDVQEASVQDLRRCPGGDLCHAGEGTDGHQAQGRWR